MSGPAVTEASVPRLPRHVKLRFDAARDRWVLLAPERIFVPDEPALEVLRCCDGRASVGAIADTLSTKFAAPRDEIRDDVIEMVQDLAMKGVLLA